MFYVPPTFNDLNEWDNDNNNYDITLLSSESRSRLNIAYMKKEAEARSCKRSKTLFKSFFLAGWRSELAGCRSTLSMSKIKVRISETKYRSFYKTLGRMVLT